MKQDWRVTLLVHFSIELKILPMQNVYVYALNWETKGGHHGILSTVIAMCDIRLKFPPNVHQIKLELLMKLRNLTQ